MLFQWQLDFICLFVIFLLGDMHSIGRCSNATRIDPDTCVRKLSDACGAYKLIMDSRASDSPKPMRPDLCT